MQDALKLIEINVPTDGIPLVKWVGNGCDTPCATYAKAHNLNVKKYCASKQQPVSYSDGGCKLANSCASIHCKDVCNAAGVICAWEKNACVSRLESLFDNY